MCGGSAISLLANIYVSCVSATRLAQLFAQCQLSAMYDMGGCWTGSLYTLAPTLQ